MHQQQSSISKIVKLDLPPLHFPNTSVASASVFCLRCNIARVSESGLIVRDIQRRVPLWWQVIHLLSDASQPSIFKVVLLIGQAISSNSS